MTDWNMVLGWGSPIGIGVFLVMIALTIYLLSKASAVSKNIKKDREDNK